MEKDSDKTNTIILKIRNKNTGYTVVNIPIVPRELADTIILDGGQFGDIALYVKKNKTSIQLTLDI